MNRFLASVATFVLFVTLGSAWSADAASPTRVSARRPHATRHHAHKVAKHHRPKHRHMI